MVANIQEFIQDPFLRQVHPRPTVGVRITVMSSLRKTRQAEAHSGAARIALAADVPLVPAAIAGTDALARLGRVSVLYGEPVRTDDLADLDPGEAARLATDRLMERIAALEESLKAQRS